MQILAFYSFCYYIKITYLHKMFSEVLYKAHDSRTWYTGSEVGNTIIILLCSDDYTIITQYIPQCLSIESMCVNVLHIWFLFFFFSVSYAHNSRRKRQCNGCVIRGWRLLDDVYGSRKTRAQNELAHDTFTRFLLWWQVYKVL